MQAKPSLWLGAALTALALALAAEAAKGQTAEPETAVEDVERAAEQRRESLEHEGWTRWWITVDERVEPADGPAPLLVALHGGGRGGPVALRRGAGFDRPAAGAGMIVAYPAGLEDENGLPGWNDGRLGEDGLPLRQWDDVGFLSAMIESMVADGRVDRAQVFVAGVSNGGVMAMRLSCERPDLLTAVAVALANTPEGARCATDAPMPALLLHGDEDELMPYGGGLVAPFFPGDHGAVRSTPDTVASWAGRNRCAEPGAIREIDDVDDGAFLEVREYQGCAAPLRHILVAGGGHTLPRFDPPWRGRLIERLLGPTSREIETADEVVGFFEAVAGGW